MSLLQYAPSNTTPLVNDLTSEEYVSPVMFLDCDFFANKTSTPKYLAARQAMPMPDASTVRISVGLVSLKRS